MLIIASFSTAKLKREKSLSCDRHRTTQECEHGYHTAHYVEDTEVIDSKYFKNLS